MFGGLYSSLLGRSPCRRILRMNVLSSRRSPTSSYYQQKRCVSHQHTQPNSIDIAKFGLLSVVSLPFAIWSASFTYNYIYRVNICKALIQSQDEDLLSDRGPVGEFLGRDKELADVSSLLEKDPTQILVISGGNEAGKTRFVRELLKRTQNITDRGVTLLQLAQLVDSVSSFTHIFVDSFNLRWLQLRHALVDVLPFAGSEILVMKERFSDRDLAQALTTITDALKRNAKERPDKPRPVIVIDGLGEGPRRWMEGNEGKAMRHRLLQWFIYITKERRLAHVILTGSEHLVLSLTDLNRATRGHIKVIGLSHLDDETAAKIVRSELPDATDDEIESIIHIFGGFLHHVRGASIEINERLTRKGKKAAKVGSKKRKEVVDKVLRRRFQQQVERVFAAFASAREDSNPNDQRVSDSSEVEEVESPLDPLKAIYSGAQPNYLESVGDKKKSDRASWTQIQLWRTLKRLCNSSDMTVSFSELRDEVFDGQQQPILELMADDVLSFEVDYSSDGGWYWRMTPASPALGLAFEKVVKNGSLKESFHQIEEVQARNVEMEKLEGERARLNREKKNLDLRKKSLLQTIELGKRIGQETVVRQRLVVAFQNILHQEEADFLC